MKYKLPFIILAFSGLNLVAQTVDKISNPVDWVNPLMVTDSKTSLSNGNTYIKLLQMDIAVMRITGKRQHGIYSPPWAFTR